MKSSANSWEDRMQIIKSRCALGAALVLFASAVWAQQQPIRLRGTIASVDGAMLAVKSRDGAMLNVKVADNATVRAVVKMSMDDIKQGSFVGVTGMPQPDGSQKAVEVHIFPEAMRGTGEGHRPWDLMPNSTMTNANVEVLVTATDGPMLTLNGEKKIVVTKDTAIVTYAAGTKDELKPGAVVFINNHGLVRRTNSQGFKSSRVAGPAANQV
jgi:hypothetical protein